MEEQAASQVVVPRVKLGAQGLEVSKLGFGCSGLTSAFGSALDDDAAAAVIAHAFRRGVTFFDTSDIYGPLTNEIMLCKALKQLSREQVQVASKFGLRRDDASGAWTVCGRPEYVRACCEASLHRLGVDCIDLYYQHRVDTTIPIEDTQRHPRFSAENLEKNKQIYLKMEELAKKHRCSPAQLALAWVLHQGDDVVPIPGTAKIKNLDANIDSLKVTLTDDDLKEISSEIREEDVAGARQNTSFEPTNWKYANTPRK